MPEASSRTTAALSSSDDGEGVVLEVGGRGVDVVDRVGDGVVEVAADHGVDRPVEGGREEHALAVGRRLVEDALDRGQKAQVSEVVGLVEDAHLHRVEAAVALLDEVLQPARAGDEDVDPPPELGDLGALADAAVDDGGPAQAHGHGQGVDGGRHLGRQLPGGDEHQRAGVARAPVLGGLGDGHDDRDGEGGRLAAAGAGPAEDVTAGERALQGGGLDGEGRGAAGPLEGGDDGGGDAQLGEGRSPRRGRRPPRRRGRAPGRAAR